MAFALAAVATALLIQPVCSWDRPGADRYRGTPAAALAHYRDIPATDRAMLAKRIAAGTPDDTVQISRTAIAGQYQYESSIADMHFGTGRMCRTVTRAKWRPAHREAGAVYCIDDTCVLVPEVCGNVSRVQRIVTSGGGTPGATGGAPALPAPSPPVALAPPSFYPAVPVAGGELPPWVEPGMPPGMLPVMGYPGPGRETTGLLPLPLAPVPEPSTWTMLAGGLALLAARAWRHWRGQAR
jgi:hypothetical protein